MLINLRNALMAGKRLPYDAEVEYLESSGTQYIDTGIAGTNDLALEGDIYLSLSSGFSSNLPFGVKAGPRADAAQRCMATTYNSVKWIYLQRGAYGYDGRAKVTVSQDGWHYMYLSKSKAVIDDTAATPVMPWNVSPENSEPVHIFGFNNNGVANPAKARCRYFRIYQNDTLVRDFIPVRVGTVGYLYDRVTGKLFGNAGTGAFTYGNDLKYPIPAS